MSDVHALPVQAQPTTELPKRIMRPCDHGLRGAIWSMETQIGTVEAYNRLCEAAAALRTKIDKGESKVPAAYWLTDPNFIYPRG